MALGIVQRPLILEERKDDRSSFDFNPEIESVLSDYRIHLRTISISGSQSSGKSTLANKAFGFQFTTMEEDNPGQTTKGIDMGISPNLRYILLDMEGANSCERDVEGKTYIQRMIPAFGLTVSNLLIHNISLKDVRNIQERDNLANMMKNYLKTSSEKRKILFCIRDVIPTGNFEENLKNKITQTYTEALTKVRTDLNLNSQSSEESKNTSNARTQIDDVFEFHVSYLSPYNRIKGRFKNEEEDLNRLRGKIEELLGNTHSLQANQIYPVWKDAWDTIHREGMVDYCKIIIQQEWRELKDDLMQKLGEIKGKIREKKSKSAGIQELHDYFNLKINELYEAYPDRKAACLALYTKDLGKRAIKLEKQNFKNSVSRYFDDKSSPPNLYHDLLRIYKDLDREDKEKWRLNALKYAKYLHKKALKQNLHILTIMKGLEEIYQQSYERIKVFDSPNNDQEVQSYISGVISRFQAVRDKLYSCVLDFIVLNFVNIINPVFDNLFFVKGVLGVEVLGSIAIASRIGGSLGALVGVGVAAIGAGITIGMLSRESAREVMAETVRFSISKYIRLRISGKTTKIKYL
jgi:hypothetical protein